MKKCCNNCSNQHTQRKFCSRHSSTIPFDTEIRYCDDYKTKEPPTDKKHVHKFGKSSDAIIRCGCGVTEIEFFESIKNKITFDVGIILNQVRSAVVQAYVQGYYNGMEE